MTTQITGIHKANQRSATRARSHPPNIFHKSIALAGWMFALPFNLSGLVIDRISSLIPSTVDEDLPSAWGYKNRGGVVKRTPVVYGANPIERLREQQWIDRRAIEKFMDEFEEFVRRDIIYRRARQDDPYLCADNFRPQIHEESYTCCADEGCGVPESVSSLPPLIGFDPWSKTGPQRNVSKDRTMQTTRYDGKQPIRVDYSGMDIVSQIAAVVRVPIAIKCNDGWVPVVLVLSRSLKGLLNPDIGLVEYTSFRRDPRGYKAAVSLEQFMENDYMPRGDQTPPFLKL